MGSRHEVESYCPLFQTPLERSKMKVKIATGKGAKGNKSTTRNITINKLYNKLRKPTVNADKHKADWIIFANMTDRKRKTGSIGEYYGAIIDFDHTPLSIDDISKIMRGYNHAVHSTYSYDPDSNGSFHLFVPFPQPIPKEDYANICDNIVRLFPKNANADPSTKTLPRIMYLPTIRTSSSPYEFRCRRKTTYWPVSGDDWAFDEDKPTNKFDPKSRPNKGDRNMWFTRYGGYCCNNGDNLEDAIQSALNINSELTAGLSDSEVRTTIKSAYRTHERKHGALSKSRFAEWIFCTMHGKLYNTRIKEMVTKETFNAVHIPQGKNVFGTLMGNKDIAVADKLQFSPADDLLYKRNKVRFINTYTPITTVSEQGSVKVMLDHFRYLFTTAIERDILLDFIANCVQNPGSKVKWMPVIKGRSGVGKSTIANAVMGPVLGTSNVTHIDNTSMIGDSFNSWQLDAQVIVFHELNLGSSAREKRMLTDSLKSLITDEYFLAHRKGSDPYQVENHANVMGFTNAEDAISITMDERRYCIIRSDSEPKPDEYYDKFYKWARANIGAMLHYFEHRDIEDFNPNQVPSTEYTKQVKSMSQVWPKALLLDCLADHEHVLSSLPVVSLSYLQRLVQEESQGTRDADRAAGLGRRGNNQNIMFNRDLEELGFRRFEDNLRVHDARTGKQELVYYTPNTVHDSVSANDAKRIVLDTKIPDEWS